MLVSIWELINVTRSAWRSGMIMMHATCYRWCMLYLSIDEAYSCCWSMIHAIDRWRHAIDLRCMFYAIDRWCIIYDDACYTCYRSMMHAMLLILDDPCLCYRSTMHATCYRSMMQVIMLYMMQANVHTRATIDDAWYTDRNIFVSLRLRH